ncbi:hypothetical protein BDQ94DRAFT_183878 [Aspergillus welwitschiae]|uniref:Uncharacterized protein n=1 Tax=Aspergillus welwitschiae TaxID=1341132 RepID=A0A3F3QCK9_9EURO|nr:hypothetical protein BDQ94DRAFT_183878 [Aspergillus welwitschiae]RDH36931.1 hypothetical protein BDQ94DRAFT_183878 [Aspergillus welwitschiae]
MEIELDFLLEDLRHAEQRAKKAELDVKHAEQVEEARQEAKLGVKRAKLRHQQLQVEPSSLSVYLEECHKRSLAISFQTNMSKTYHGSIDPFGRLRPKRIIPWGAFPTFQQAMWKAIDDEDPEFSTHRAFASKNQLEFIGNGATRPIASESHLQSFQSETVDNHVQSILVEMNNNERLRQRFNIHGYVRSEHEDNDNNAFYIHVESDEQEVSLYAVEYQTPHVLSMSEIIAGLHVMHLDDDFIDNNGAVITQLFSNMANIGVQYGYIYTGEAFICLHITEDPSVVQYYLLIPNLDVTDGDEFRLQRTAVAHVLALTLNTMQATPPPQSWYDAAEQLDEWEIDFPDPDYPDPLEHIPGSDRENGFEQLHIFCRTGFLLKATTNEQLPSLDVPVLIGDFAPQVQHWYHGEQMAHILILS